MVLRFTDKDADRYFYYDKAPYIFLGKKGINHHENDNEKIFVIKKAVCSVLLRLSN